MSRRARSCRALAAPLALCAALWAAGGCPEDDCLGDADLVAGCGARVDGAAVLLGDPFADVEAALGTPAATRDLGSLGIWFDYPTLGLSGFHAVRDGVAVVTHLELGAGFPGSTAGGVGVGAGGEVVSAEFGDPPRDPYLGSSWSPSAGIALAWSDGEVARIQIVPPQP